MIGTAGAAEDASLSPKALQASKILPWHVTGLVAVRILARNSKKENGVPEVYIHCSSTLSFTTSF